MPIAVELIPGQHTNWLYKSEFKKVEEKEMETLVGKTIEITGVFDGRFERNRGKIRNIIGEKFKVTKEDKNDTNIPIKIKINENEEIWLHKSEFKIVEEKKEENKMKIKIGDEVRILTVAGERRGNRRLISDSIGKNAEVIKIDEFDNEMPIKVNIEGRCEWLYSNEFIKIDVLKSKENINPITTEEQNKKIEEINLQIAELEKKKKEILDEEVLVKTIIVDRIVKTEDNYKERKFRMEYYKKGNKTTCKMFRVLLFQPVGEPVGIGVSYCSPEDEYDFLKGAQLAEMRALKNYYTKIEENMTKSMF